MNTIRRLWHDQNGFVVTTDALLFGTILVLGSLVGLVTLRDHLVQELGDVGAALGNLNQSFSVEGFDCDEGSVAGSSFADKSDFGEEGENEGDDNGDAAGEAPSCISVNVAPSEES